MPAFVSKTAGKDHHQIDKPTHQEQTASKDIQHASTYFPNIEPMDTDSTKKQTQEERNPAFFVKIGLGGPSVNRVVEYSAF